MSAGGSSSSSSAKDYFADIACVLCAGPVDRLCAIYVDGNRKWPQGGDLATAGLNRVGQPNPVQISVPDYGTVWFYWGERNQVLDAAGEAILAAQGHPPYRGQAVAVLKEFLFGRNRTSAPNIEFVVQRRPRQDLITGPAADLDADGQANPLAVIAEVLTDPVFGIGAPLALFDQGSWQATADALLPRASLTYVSPACEASSAVRSRLDEVKAYYDGWFRWSPTGRIVAGRFLHDEAPPAFTAANTVTADDLVEEAEILAEGWAKTSNEAVVKFTNAGAEFKDDSYTATSGYNRAVTGEPRQLSLERPWITRAGQAARHAAEALKLESEPAFAGKLRVRGVKAAVLPVGTVFRLVHDLLGLDLVARVTERELPAPPSETGLISFVTERGLSSVRALTGAEAEPEPAPAPVERLGRFQLLQPPSALLGDNYRLVALLARSSALTVAARVWFQQADLDGQFQQLGAQSIFAIAGALTVAFPISTGDDNTEALKLSILDNPPSSDLERISEAQTEDQVNDGALLLFIFSAIDPRDYEILSIRSLRLVGAEWLAKVRRGQFGTKPRAWAAGDQAWAIPRENIVDYTHEYFPALSRAESVGTFRLQGVTPFGIADLYDPDQCPDIPYTFREAHPDDITSFLIAGRRLSWTPLDDLYISGYRIRYQLGTRQVWSDAVSLHEGLLTSSPYEPAVLPAGTVTFMIKAVDTAGAESLNAAIIVTDLGDAFLGNVIESYDLAALGWPGTLTGGSIDGLNQLAADSVALMWQALGSTPMWSTLGTDAMWPPDSYAPMTWITQVTLGAPLPGSTLSLDLEIAGDPWSVFWRECAVGPMWAADDSALMWAADDSVTFLTTAPWAPWPGLLADPRAEIYEFMVVTGGGALQGRVNHFAVIVDAPDIEERFDDIAIDPAGSRLAITQAYRAIKNVQLTLQTDGGGAVTARVEDKDALMGPLVKCFDAAGAGVGGLLDAVVKGY